MAQLESIDGKLYEIPDDVLARYRIGDDTVGQLRVAHDDLPVAPPPQEGWDAGEPPRKGEASLEDNPFVRTRRGPNNELIINVVVPGVQ